MVMRKVPRSASATTGRAYSRTAGRSLGHQSALERDAYLASSFLPGLLSIEEQPCRIQSDEHSYRPDTCLRMEVHTPSGSELSDFLVEIKYLDDLQKNFEEYRPRIELGVEYAHAQGWKFKILTEVEIRGQDFPAVRFLRRYLGGQVADPVRAWVLGVLPKGPRTLIELLEEGSKALGLTARGLIPQVWTLVAHQEVHLSSPPQLNLYTRLYQAPSTPDPGYWVPCHGLIDALLAPWEVRP